MAYTIEELERLALQADDAGNQEDVEYILSVIDQMSAPQQPPMREEVPEASFLDELELEFDLGTTDITKSRTLLNAFMPTPVPYVEEVTPEGTEDEVGRQVKMGFKTPTEYWGEEFMNASFRERVEMQEKWRRDGVMKDEQHQQTVLAQEAHGANPIAQFLGGTGKALLSPTSAAPLGKTPTVMLAIGGAVGLEGEALTQAVEGEFNPVKLATGTALGSVLTPVVAVGGAKVVQKTANAVGKIPKLIRDIALDEPPTTLEALRASRMILDTYAERVALGNELDDAAKVKLHKELGFSNRDLLRIQQAGVDLPPVPTLEEAQAIQGAKTTSLASTSAVGRYLDSIAAPMSTVLSNIDAGVGGALRKHDYRVSTRIAETEEKVKGFASALQKLKSRKGDLPDPSGKGVIPASRLVERFERDLLSGRFDSAENIAKVYFPEIMPVWKDSRKVLSDLYIDLVDTGRKIDYNPNYFPRMIKDYRGLMNAIGGDKWEGIEGKLMAEARKRGLDDWRGMEDKLKSDLINKELSAFQTRGTKFGNLEDRAIENVTKNIQQFYYEPAESLLMYVNKAVRDVEKRKFFGKNNLVYDPKTKEVLEEESLGSFIRNSLQNRKDLTPSQVGDMVTALQVRFNEGEMAAGGVMGFAKDVQHLSLLAQQSAAVTQLGDIGVSAYANGLVPTIGSLLTGFRRDKNLAVSMSDLGLSRRLPAEIGTIGGMSKVLDTSFTWSGFRFSDRLGKTTFLNAALKKNAAIALKGPKKIEEKWGNVFGAETADLITDLKAVQAAMKAGQKPVLTDNVKLLMWNELADVQPISLSEMPEKYLKYPGGRIFYALKSFAIKQLDIMRRDILQEARRGNSAKAAKNLITYATSIGLAGGSMQLVRDLVTKKETDIDSFPDKVFETWASLFFANQYMRNKYLERGQVAQAALATLAPAAPEIVDTFITGIAKGGIAAYEGEDVDFGPVVGAIPMYGKLIHDWVLGGAEARLERERQTEERKYRESLGLSGRN